MTMKFSDSKKLDFRKATENFSLLTVLNFFISFLFLQVNRRATPKKKKKVAENGRKIQNEKLIPSDQEYIHSFIHFPTIKQGRK